MGRGPSARDKEPAKAAELVAIKGPHRRGLPGPRHVQQKDREPAGLLQEGGCVADLIAGGGQYYRRPWVHGARRQPLAAILETRGGHRTQAATSLDRGRLIARSVRQPARPQPVRSDPLRRHEGVAIGDGIHELLR